MISTIRPVKESFIGKTDCVESGAQVMQAITSFIPVRFLISKNSPESMIRARAALKARRRSLAPLITDTSLTDFKEAAIRNHPHSIIQVATAIRNSVA